MERSAARRQRDRSDREDQWWARAQWALDLTMSDDSETRTVGYRMLDALAVSGTRDAVTPDERAAAARARVSADEERGVATADWIVQLATGR